jgi:hypothetical protein
LRQRWEEELSADLSGEENLASLLLGDALLRNDRGTVLFSSSREDRLGLAAGVLRALGEPAKAAQVRRFRELVCSEVETSPASVTQQP